MREPGKSDLEVLIDGYNDVANKIEELSLAISELDTNIRELLGVINDPEYIVEFRGGNVISIPRDDPTWGDEE